MSLSISNKLQLNNRALVVIFFALQIASIVQIWQHTSDTAILFGRFSMGYGIAAVGSVVSFVIWGAIIWQHQQMMVVLKRLPSLLRQIAIILLSTVTLLLWQLLRIESQLLTHITLNILFVQILLIFTLPTSSEQKRWWWIAVVILGILVAVPLAIYALGGRDFSPDEALWADQAIAYLVDGKIYRRALYAEPWAIMPGKGWFITFYANMMATFGFDIRVGRTIGILFDFATYGMIFVVARYLYNWRVAILSTMLTLLGSTYALYIDYRPDHYNAVFFLIAFFASLKTWHPETRYKIFWGFVSGLAPTLAMQMHANALMMSITVVVFHGMMWLRGRLQAEHRTSYDHTRFIAMIAGAGLGAGIYFVFNVLPVGGMSVFLNNLVDERATYSKGLNIRYLTGLPLLELGLIFLAFLAILLHYDTSRHRTSRGQVIGFTAIFMLAILIFDAQGYAVAYRALFYVHMGYGLWTLAQLSGTQNVADNHNRIQWLAGIIIIAFFASFTMLPATSGTVRNILSTGQLPDHRIHAIADEIAQRLTPSELVISTHELLWGVGTRDNFYSEAAQIHRARIWGITPAEVWERIRPDTVVYIEGRMTLPDELATYIANNMVICEQYPSYGYQVIFYRVACS
jgi:hypothetical protein